MPLTTAEIITNEITADDDSSSSMKGIKSGNSMLISGGTFTIDSADDSIHSNIFATINGGTFQLASGDDAIHSEENLTATDGKINISSCYEGLEALHVKVSGGDVKLKASDERLPEEPLSVQALPIWHSLSAIPNKG